MTDPFDHSVAIPGYAELYDWCGSFPTFDDAYVNRLDLHVDGSGEMLVRGFQVTKEVDAHGIEVELLPTYGVGGRLTMERLKIAFEPVDYDGTWPPT